MGGTDALRGRSCGQVVSGDYVAYVHIIEARDLKAEDWQVRREVALVWDCCRLARPDDISSSPRGLRG